MNQLKRRRALSNKTPYGKYARPHYDSAVEALASQYGFTIDKLHEDITEFCSGEIPIVRMLYNNSQNMIIVSFHLITPSVEAIQLFDFVRKSLSHVALGESYYVNADGELFIGPDAHANYEMDVENHYLMGTNLIEEEEDYKPIEPITMSISYPLYAANHPLSKKQNTEFRKRMAIFQGKVLE